MTAIDHATLEREARKMCEEARGEGVWDHPKCHRNYWRKKVVEVATLAEQFPGFHKLLTERGWFV